MKNLTSVFFLVFFIATHFFSQTQLMRSGNAAQYWYDTSPPELWLTTNSEIIDGKEYFKRKILYYPWFGANCYKISYERIEGDSLYYILSSNNTDSLAFNFNWKPGTFVKVDTVGNSIYYERIDSIMIETTYLSNDTVYYVGLFGINLITKDTLPRLPQQKRVYKKFGLFDMGIWGYLEGVKVDGIRYGTVYPFPEEISISSDSIYISSIIDTGSVFIINNSDYDLRVDSIISLGSFYGYRGWFTLPETELGFYLYQKLPDEWYGVDSLGIIIPMHDSLKVSFYDVDLCPICYSNVQDYFIDTLRFVFNFNYYGNYNYDFSKFIQISGEGHPSGIEQTNTNPEKLTLYQNYPNPFNPNTNIQYKVSHRRFVSIQIYNMLGENVAILVNEEKPEGSYVAEFNASSLPSGIYFYQMKAGSFFQMKKMILLR